MRPGVILACALLALAVVVVLFGKIDEALEWERPSQHTTEKCSEVLLAEIAVVDARTKVNNSSLSPLQAVFNAESPNSYRLKGCHHVYLDVGSNVGVQVRKLFETDKYPKTPTWLRQMYNTFGNIESIRRHVCVFGFEANPKHFERLRQVEKCYTKMGWATAFYGPAAVSNVNGKNISLVMTKSDEQYNFWGAQAKTDWNSSAANQRYITFDVPTFSLADFILNVLHTRELNSSLGPPFVLMKMDIESSEYAVLLSMLLRGALRVVNASMIEFHEHPKSKTLLPLILGLFGEDITSDFPSGPKYKQSVEQRAREQLDIFGEPAPRILKVDDESHLKDGVDFPLGC